MEQVITKKKTKMKLSRVIFILSFILIPVINFLVFYVYVNFDGILMAFYRLDFDGNKIWGMKNFTQFFDELKVGGTIYVAFINTFKTFGINLLIFPWGIVVAYFLYKKIYGYNVFRILFFLPSIINSIIVVIIYKKMISVDGPIAMLVQRMFNLTETPDILGDARFANAFVWLHMLWLAFPGDMIIWGGAFSRIPDSVIEAAKLDGANWVTELVRIILPMVWPTFALKFIMLFSGVFGASGAVFLLTNGGAGTMTFSAWQYIQIRGNGHTPPPTSTIYNYVSAIGILVTLVAMVIVGTCRYIEGKFFKDLDY